MTLRVHDRQSESNMDRIRNSCDVLYWCCFLVYFKFDLIVKVELDQKCYFCIALILKSALIVITMNNHILLLILVKQLVVPLSGNLLQSTGFPLLGLAGSQGRGQERVK